MSSTAVLAPKSLEELGQLIADLHAEGRPWVPSGLGSRLHWGPPLAADSGPVLSMRELSGIIDHAVDDLTITVDAGMPLADLQAALAEHQQWLPLNWPWGSSMASPSSAGTIGGLVARGLSGGLRQRHLGVRDQIIGISLIRSDGVSARAGGRVVKNVAGYDLMRLLCGSWGSLALISALTLRVQPIREPRGQLVLDGDVSQLEAFRAAVVGSSFTPEWMDWELRPDQGAKILLGVASISDGAVVDQLNRLETLADQQGLSTERMPWETPIPEGSFTHEDPAWLLRLCLPPAQLQHLFSSRECTALKGWSWQLAAGAGSGEAWQPSGSPTPEYLIEALRRRVMELGGQLSALIQPGTQPGALPAWLDAPSRPLIEAVKHQFDPKQQLCRGRLPGVAAPLNSAHSGS
ncbi:FAD-binding oxidoreductase [Synechococcus sp. MVIR-18-1]|uniref:FAD-binding oxidoreductase n=1 Tax=Synechococcus sp. MVIR-18-1 TaxID=1386941 RepID=UPI0016489699|nr:FAD-binding oxidoreductase [Synechococcus sp. MVIR-18-1]QNI75276.1 glycolate oxidase subunit GlcE [Synechococcus sp. MVIR-18-1]